MYIKIVIFCIQNIFSIQNRDKNNKFHTNIDQNNLMDINNKIIIDNTKTTKKL